MRLNDGVQRVAEQLAAAAALGDERTRDVAGALAATVAPAVRLAVLEALAAAAQEINAGLLDVPGTPTVGIRLDGDDRSGSNVGGENMFIDLTRVDEIRRILVFAFIYEGVPNWASADGVVTLFPAAGPEIEVRLDESDPSSPTCVIAMLENRGGELVVRREVRYIRGGQSDVDAAYGWGMEWARGRK